ncbi:hypothetical protein EIP86_008684 [Pleurotus ostreatoroseus]|nr:hypothetical protein EIP86_008684 [Pleurotus ostreatoroseus]
MQALDEIGCAESLVASNKLSEIKPWDGEYLHQIMVDINALAKHTKFPHILHGAEQVLGERGRKEEDKLPPPKAI